MRRFRPNLVVAGAAPFAEDTWREIRIGAVCFRVATPCPRCAITTRDPDTGEQIDPYEPLRTLQRFHRARDGGAMFGQCLIPDNEGIVGIGDKVEVLSAGGPYLMREVEVGSLEPAPEATSFIQARSKKAEVQEGQYAIRSRYDFASRLAWRTCRARRRDGDDRHVRRHTRRRVRQRGRGARHRC